MSDTSGARRKQSEASITKRYLTIYIMVLVCQTISFSQTYSFQTVKVDHAVAAPMTTLGHGIRKVADADDLLTLSGRAVGAVRDLNDAYENLIKAQKAAHEVLDGKKPAQISDDKWAGLAQKYNDAARTIAEAPSITDFDKTKYEVSIGELSNCTTHVQAIAKLRGYLKELQDALNRSTVATKLLNDGLKFAETSDEVVSDLIKASATLATLPDIGDVFVWNWADLELVVRPSVRNFISASKRHIKKLGDETKKVSIYESNLRGNLPEVEKLCILPGTWQGNITFSLGGGTFTLGTKLILKNVGPSYTGEVQVTNNTQSPKHND
jgi:hypothetical protein